jgi:hypothetical protein
MTRAALFPTPAAVEASTPAGRDRAIDVIGIVSLIGVVVGHTIMATSILRNDVFYWSNLLAASPVFQALTWVFQIMPLFFFAGVAASVSTWTPGTSWGGWLMRRCTRLYRPVFSYLAFWVVTLAMLRLVLPEHVYAIRSPGSASSCCGSSAPTCWCSRRCRCSPASPPPAA